MEVLKKDVEGYEGIYAVCSDGRILSSPKSNRFTHIELSATINGKGYNHVCLQKNGSKKMCRVHRLVAQMFIPNPENKPFVNHKDGNKQNNSLGNLEWCTQKENVFHNLTILKNPNNVPRKLTFAQAEEVRELSKNGLSSRKIGLKFGVDHKMILNIIKYKTYRWE